MDGRFAEMEDLEAFLAQDSSNYWPPAGTGDTGSSSFDQYWWDLSQQGFDSDLFASPLEVNADGLDFQAQHSQAIEDLAELPCYSVNHQNQDFQQGQQLLLEHLELDQQQHQKASPQGYHQEQQVEQPQEEEEEEEEVDGEEDDEGEGESDGKKQTKQGRSRNLVFERKRRKRLNQQLMTLRSLVPNITKMDKRSILVDAFAYLQNVLQETESKLEELNLNSNSSMVTAAPTSSSSSSSGDQESCTTIVEDETPPPATTTVSSDSNRYALVPTVTKMEASMLDEERFILKVGCNKAVGAVGLVQKAIEMLAGLHVTCASIDQLDGHPHMLTTSFLRVRKKGVMTEEKLLQQFRTNAAKLGLLL